ncbi:hypothetical protein RQP46_010633 [Phenoliferia psychrophenolica]
MQLLVHDRTPVHVVGEVGGRGYTIALAALRGSFDGILVSHDSEEAFLFQPRFSDEQSTLEAIDQVWKRAADNADVTELELDTFAEAFWELGRETTAPPGTILDKILHNISRTANPRHLDQFYLAEPTAPSHVIHFPYPFTWEDRPKLLRDFIESSAPAQSSGDLLLITVCTDPYFRDMYAKNQTLAFARESGYDVMEEDTGLMDACFRFGFSHTSFPKSTAFKTGRIDQTLHEETSPTSLLLPDRLPAEPPQPKVVSKKRTKVYLDLKIRRRHFDVGFGRPAVCGKVYFELFDDTQPDLTEYIRQLWYSMCYDRSLKVTEEGVIRFETHYELARPSTFRDLARSEDEALEAGLLFVGPARGEPTSSDKCRWEVSITLEPAHRGHSTTRIAVGKVVLDDEDISKVEGGLALLQQARLRISDHNDRVKVMSPNPLTDDAFALSVGLKPYSPPPRSSDSTSHTSGMTYWMSVGH